MCTTTICLYPWLPDSVVVSVSLVLIAGIVVWKIIKSIIDSIPVVG